MSQSINQPSKVLEMCKAQYSAHEILPHFFQLNNWAEESDLQLAIQHRIVQTHDVEAAIGVLMRSEFKCNIAFDFDEIMNVVLQYAYANQALKALRKVHLAPAHELQSIVLSKGSHEQIIELKAWQLSPNKLEPKRSL